MEYSLVFPTEQNSLTKEGATGNPARADSPNGRTNSDISGTKFNALPKTINEHVSFRSDVEEAYNSFSKIVFCDIVKAMITPNRSDANDHRAMKNSPEFIGSKREHQSHAS